MDLATGAMASLLLKLVKLLNNEYNLQKGVKKDVQFLERELRSMHAALRKVAEVPRDQLDELVRIWADEVRELSYTMEDVVDGFLMRVQGSEPTANPQKLKQLMEKMGNLFKKGTSRHQIADAIKDIKDQVREVADRRDRYKINDLVTSPAATTAVDPRMFVMYKDQKEIVGIDVARDALIKRLTDGKSKKQLMILSVFGSGGLGKTTLAKVVYDRIEEQFDCRAFVTVGRDPDVKGVFKDILFQLDKKEYKEFSGAVSSEKHLIDLLRGLLRNKRYFIVIDDVWDIKTWEMIKCILIDSDCGSRIITTSRIFHVASKAGDVCKLEPLPQNKSEELFYTRLFGGKVKCPLNQPTEIIEKVLQKCGGVPLAIITIASLLSSKPMEDWSRVYNSIGFGYEDNEHVENTRKILLFSYYDLPCYLRTCLLYLCIFPEDDTIMKDTLIWKWVAEGFVHNESGTGLFELGERYFNELINRSMMQRVEYPEKGIVYACRVHDLVLDMIHSMAKEENFVTVLDSNKKIISSQRNPRRLAIQKRIIDKDDPIGNINMPQVRSFNAIMCHFSVMPLLSGFQALRVLAIEGCTYETFPLDHLGRFVQLRYLEISRMGITELPGGIGDLRFLQTLDLRETKIRVLPHSVRLLKQLKCLRIGSSLITISDWIENLTTLEELSPGIVSPEFVTALGKLTELRELRFKLEKPDDDLIKDLMQSLCYLKKLQVLQVSVHDYTGWTSCEGYMPPPELRHLKLDIQLLNLPSWINPMLLPNLSTLHVPSYFVEAPDVEILGSFSELITLSCSGIFRDISGGGAFPKLRYLRTSSKLQFLQGAMPSLEFINLTISVVGWKINKLDFNFSSLGNLHCLQKVRVYIITEGARVKDIEKLIKLLRRAINTHPNRPILTVSSDDISLEKGEFDHNRPDDEAWKPLAKKH